jgi:type II secretory pathway component PulC
VVLSVNDQSLTDPASALEVYSKLKSATAVKFAIRRAGEPRTITWNIR